MGRKSIPILLKATSPEGETKTFTSIGEAAKELGLRPPLHEPELASTRLRGSTCNKYLHDRRSQPGSTLLAG